MSSLTAAVQSVQDVPLGSEQRESVGSALSFIMANGPILPRFGTRARDVAIWRWYINDRNWLFRSASAGISKKIASTPFKIIGENPDVSPEQAREILLGANFGSGWRDFVMGWVFNFLTHSTLGAVTEVIGPGDPRGPIWGKPTGIALLDPFYCFPTGNPTWPVIYWDAPRFKHHANYRSGVYRWLHHERVCYTVDTPLSRHRLPGVGECAADRAISIMYENIYSSAYVGESLDDRPQPGIYHLHNIDMASWNAAWEIYRNRIYNDALDEKGRNIDVRSIQTDAPSKIELLQFAAAPDKFDYAAYTNLQAKATAAALGVDVQEIWEITGSQQLGTATQSEVLARKGEGKTEADIYAALERMTVQMNLLPAGYNLEFEFKDQEKDQIQAQIAAQYQSSVTQSVASGIVTAEQGRRYLKLVDTTWERVLSEPETEVATDRDPVEDDEPPVVIFRDWSQTRGEFVAELSNVFQRNHTGVRGGRRLSNSIRALLRRYGEQAYRDGAEEAGAPLPDTLGTRDKIRLQSWLSDEGKFVTQLIQGQQELRAGLTPAQADLKADFWANKSLRNAYNLSIKNTDVMLEWVLNPVKENCVTCLSLNGQIHPASEWKESGWQPGVRWLECGGWQCGCEFQARPGAEASGDLAGVQKVVRRNLPDEAADFARALRGEGCTCHTR